MNNFLSFFTPKETKFFPVLKQLSQVSIRASELMIELLQNYNHETISDYYKLIKEEEKKGDTLTNKIFDDLNSTFITPFDREDIHTLANKMDDVTDIINTCAKKIMLYNPKQIPASTLQIAVVLKKCTIAIDKAVQELDILKKNPKNVKQYCKQLHDYEHDADDVYENFLIELFENEKNAIEVIKIKEIMSELEKATDIAEYVGKIIQTIIIKYA
ncbi:MAG: phosphate transport regulator [Porphyromonadaceae bacterium CG2_30_38_12]|nr:MAG: phosphate transport regulator [Porphyromonadaceae bacterium CG2_30_38_12]